jgi:hypothetical protein
MNPDHDLTATRIDREVPHDRGGSVTGVVRPRVTVGQRTGNSLRVA